MSKFKVLTGTYKDKEIIVATYKPTAQGVEIKITHNLTAPAGKSLRWVQTIAENGSFFKSCGKRGYVDPWGPTGPVDPKTGKNTCQGDDDKPFYWTDVEETTRPYFYDRPSESPPAKGGTWLRFITSLSETTGNDVLILVSVVWGFDIFAGGKVNTVTPRSPTGVEQNGHRLILKQMYPAYHFSIVK
jgi:hypothetical protein